MWLSDFVDIQSYRVIFCGRFPFIFDLLRKYSNYHHEHIFEIYIHYTFLSSIKKFFYFWCVEYKWLLKTGTFCNKTLSGYVQIFLYCVSCPSIFTFEIFCIIFELISYNAASGISIPFWDFTGSVMITNSYIRLTPDLQSRSGAIWNNVVSCRDAI